MWVPTFQFHKGTIKTLLLKTIEAKDKEFQFHKGTIKTNYQASYCLLYLISIP